MSTMFEQLLETRRSIRAYTDQPVDLPTLEHILTLARKAPSGANLQPGRFHVLSGQPLRALVDRLHVVLENGAPIDEEYSYFPKPMSPELKQRQRAAGYALYQALGISRRDVKGRKDQFARNYAFFGAPVGIVVTIDRDMGKGCFMDLGMSLMALLLAAEDQGLGATGIGALANYGTVVHTHLNLPASEMVVCGIAIGHPDRTAPVNRFRTERAPLDAFTSFSGFD